MLERDGDAEVVQTGRIPVVAAVIEREQRFLVGLRPPGKRHAGFWEFPGGKRRPGESIMAALTRELQEELSLQVVSVGAVIFRTADPGSRFTIEFVQVRARGVPQRDEHIELAWNSAAELATLRLAPADARFVAEVLADRIPKIGTSEADRTDDRE